jgi:hypothetical protein
MIRVFARPPQIQHIGQRGGRRHGLRFFRLCSSRSKAAISCSVADTLASAWARPISHMAKSVIAHTHTRIALLHALHGTHRHPCARPNCARTLSAAIAPAPNPHPWSSRTAKPKATKDQCGLITWACLHLAQNIQNVGLQSCSDYNKASKNN